MKQFLLIISLLFLILQITFSQNVTIPDAAFKACLLQNADINTNGDDEIQITEAESFTGTIQCASRQISSLEGIEEFIELDGLICFNNELSNLNVTSNTKLTWLQCYANEIESLDLSKNSMLKHINCHSNKLDSLDCSKNTELTQLYFQNNQLEKINNDNLVKLERYIGYKNNLSSFDISEMPELTQLNMSDNPISSVDFTKNQKLLNVRLDNCGLTTLDLSQNPEMGYLSCVENELTVLDFINNEKLFFISCYNNELSDLNFHDLPELKHVYASGNLLKSLDFSMNPLLEDLSVSNNLLTYLNVANGTDSSITYLSAIENPNLECIQVNNVQYSSEHVEWFKDENSEYSLNCGFVSSSLLNRQEQLNVFPNPAHELLHLDIESFNVSSLAVFGIAGNTVLRLQKASPQLDISTLESGSYVIRIDDQNGKQGLAHFVKY